MNERLKRIKDYEDFKLHTNEIFGELSKYDASNKRLDGLFSLCICPGGRDGGTNDKEVEVFYGNRAIGMRTVHGPNMEVQKKIEIAHGATLSYFRTDDGHVICNLYPAKSENQNPIEEIFLLDYVKSPADLRIKAKIHWKMFISCMEATCIDGNPSVVHRLRYFYIKTFKQCVVGRVLQDRKATLFLKGALKFAFTVGLSGFIILAFTTCKEHINNRNSEAKAQKLEQLIENMNRSANNINETLKENNLLLQKMTKDQDLIKYKERPTNDGRQSAR